MFYFYSNDLYLTVFSQLNATPRTNFSSSQAHNVLLGMAYEVIAQTATLVMRYDHLLLHSMPRVVQP